MHNELTNLLPLERQRALHRDYFVRLCIVALVLVTVLIAATAVLLVPTYVFLSASAQTKEERLASIESTLSSGDEAVLSDQLTRISKSAAMLTTLANAPSASEILRTALAITRPGVSLSSFEYTPAAGKSLGILKISGNAATRDALRQYQLAVSSAPFAHAADLPVSAYAKDSDIGFTITVTLAP